MDKNYMDEVKGQIISSCVDSSTSEKGLISPQQLKQKVSLEVEAALSELNEVYKKGFLCLYKAYHKQQSAEVAKIDFLELDNLIQSEDVDKLEISSAFLEKIKNIDLESICRAHNLLEKLIQENKFAEARNALYLLVNLSPDFPPLLLSLGSVEYALGNLDAALLAYTAAAVLDPEDPLPLLHGAYCLKENRNYSEGLNYITKALEIINHNAAFNDLKPSAEELRVDLKLAA